MKIVLACDKFLYKKFVMNFPKYNDAEELVGSYLSESEYDNFWIADKDKINYTVNSLDGLKDVYTVIVQYSWYRNIECINLCKYMKVLHPETKVIFFMDDVEIDEQQYFKHRIINENLGLIAHNLQELESLFSSNLDVHQQEYLLAKAPKKLKKEFERS